MSSAPSITEKGFICTPVELLGRDDLTNRARRVYECLLFFRNRQTGQCSPRRATIASKIGLSVPTVTRGIGELAAKGLIARRRKSNCNEYEMVPPKLWKEAPRQPEQRIKVDPSDGSTVILLMDQNCAIRPSPSLLTEPDVIEPEVLQPSETAAQSEAAAPTQTELVLFSSPPITTAPEPEAPHAPPPPPNPSFEQWWAIYWRKASRKQAERAFNFHVKTQDRFEQVMRATLIQTPAMMAREPAYRPYAANWLHDERWTDEASLPARKPPQSQSSSLVERTKALWARRIARGERPI